MRKIAIAPAIGVSANLLTKGEMKTFLTNTTQYDKQQGVLMNGVKSAYFNGIASIGFEYKLSSSLSISIASTVRFALNSINKEGPVQSYPSSLGVAFRPANLFLNYFLI